MSGPIERTRFVKLAAAKIEAYAVDVAASDGELSWEEITEALAIATAGAAHRACVDRRLAEMERDTK